MLKGKKSIYILLPVNLLIWGYMAYKIYITLHEPEEPSVGSAAPPQPKVKPTDNVAYTLKLNYKDPFLKQEIKQKKSVYAGAHAVVPAPAAKSRTPVVKEVPPAPDIKYVGLIENKTSGSVSAMVSVNGSSQIIKPGQALGDIVFQSFTHEYLTVKIGREKLMIKK